MKAEMKINITKKQYDMIEQAAKDFRCDPSDFVSTIVLAFLETNWTDEDVFLHYHHQITRFVHYEEVPDVTQWEPVS